MTNAVKSNWLVPAALLALGIVPMVAGTLRLVQLGAGAGVTPDSARFFAAPWPFVVHMVSATLFSALGALQFAPGLRRRKPGWHRMAGRWLVLFGLATAMSGLWMTQFYPPGPEAPASFDGAAVYVLRLLVGSAMALSLCLGVAAVLRRDIPRHQAWMMRGYALGLGAGTQVFTHLPWFLLPGIQGELARALCMGTGWAISLFVAEWLISRGHKRAPAEVTATGPDRVSVAAHV